MEYDNDLALHVPATVREKYPAPINRRMLKANRRAAVLYGVIGSSTNAIIELMAQEIRYGIDHGADIEAIKKAIKERFYEVMDLNVDAGLLAFRMPKSLADRFVDVGLVWPPADDV